VSNIGGSISVLMNNGNGTFAPKVSYATNGNASGIAMGDFNGDGKADLVSSNWSTATISVFINNGNGTFAAKVDYTAMQFPSNIVAGDLNGDNKADLVATGSWDNVVSVFINNGNGTFQNQVTYPTGYYGQSPNDVALGDVNGDSKLDIVTGVVPAGVALPSSRTTATALSVPLMGTTSLVRLKVSLSATWTATATWI